MREDLYELMARYYDDEYGAKSDLNDLDFWLRAAATHGGPVLEVGCGTGRVLLPIARQGQDIVGLDASPAMLLRLREKLADEDPAVQARVTLHQGDMREADLGRRFPLVIVPFRPLQHVYTMDDQIAALTALGRHLDDEGALVFDVFVPRHDRLAGGIGEEQHDLEWQASDEPGVRMTRCFVKEGYDPYGQTFWGHFVFRSFHGGELIDEVRDEFRMGWYTYAQLELLARAAGLEIVSTLGSFAGAPLDAQATDMILTLRRAR